ncbi:MAG: class I SAM-dependent methyltransferase [Vicingus serpentipes]|nr:class I SAM-dependent methyltransferase [Vicingus serpentipes]
MQEVKCPYCAEGTKEMWREETFTIHKCSSCTLVFKHIPELNREKVEELQADLYTDEVTRSKVKKLYTMIKDRVDILKKHKSSGRILEIGCATGAFLNEAKAQGFDVVGLDASSNYAQFTNDLGLDVRHGRLEDVAFQKEEFDVIACSHLLEHIEDPLSFLEQLKAYLKPEGVLFLVVPNEASITNKVLGYKHSTYQQPDHLYFFSKKTLINYLHKAGFEAIEILSKEYTHHIFNTIKGYFRYNNANEKASAVSDKKAVTNTGAKRKIKTQLPHIMGTALYPLTRSYGLLLEKGLKGHELIAIAKKK